MTPNQNQKADQKKTARRSTLATKFVFLSALLCATFWHNVQAQKSASAYVQTELGDSLFSIARVVNPGGGITNEQVMAALLRHNRHAFKNQNLFLMYPGARLKIPSVANFKAEQKSTARRFYQQQLQAAQNGQIPPALYALKSGSKKATVRVISKKRAPEKDNKKAKATTTQKKPVVVKQIAKQKKAEKISEPKSIDVKSIDVIPPSQKNENLVQTKPLTNIDSPGVTFIDPVAKEITEEQENNTATTPSAQAEKGFSTLVLIFVFFCIAVLSSLLAYFFSKNFKKQSEQSQYIYEQEDIDIDIDTSSPVHSNPPIIVQEKEPAPIVVQQLAPAMPPPPLHTFEEAAEVETEVETAVEIEVEAEAVEPEEPIRQEPSIIAQAEPQKDTTTAAAPFSASHQRNQDKNTHTVALDAKQALAQVETIVRKVKQKTIEESQQLTTNQLDLTNNGIRKYVGQACEEMGIERVILPPIIKNDPSEEETKKQQKTDAIKRTEA